MCHNYVYGMINFMQLCYNSAYELLTLPKCNFKIEHSLNEVKNGFNCKAIENMYDWQEITG